MDEYKVIEVKRSVFANNDADAEKLRVQLRDEKTFLLNLMSSPGSGKTTTLMRTIALLKNEMRIGVMEADIDSEVGCGDYFTERCKINSDSHRWYVSS